MATKAKIITEKKERIKKIAKERPAYLTKRILVSAAKRGIRAAAKETMEVMGYNVIARDGWVVKLFPDGSIEKITPIKRVKSGNGIALD